MSSNDKKRRTHCCRCAALDREHHHLGEHGELLVAHEDLIAFFLDRHQVAPRESQSTDMSGE